MKIKIGGVTLEEYNNSTRWEELGIVLDKPAYDLEAEIQSVISNEGLVTDMVVGGYKATKGVVNAGIKTYQGVSKGWSSIKTTWINNRPAIIKMIKDFGMSLQDMWAKFMKYEETYNELGGKIDQVLKFTIPQMGSIPNMTLYWHDFDAMKLKQMTVVLSSYKSFYDAIVNSNVMKGKYISPEEMRNLVSGIRNEQDVQKLADRLAQYSEAIGELNSGGDLGFIKALDASFNWGLFGWFGAISKKDAKNASLASVIKMSILGEQLKKTYSSDQKDTFVRDLAGGASLLNVVGSFLNNKVLADALKKGGPSVKTETDKMIKYLDQIMKEGIVKDKREEAQKEAEARAKERADKAKAEQEAKAQDEKEKKAEGGPSIEIPQFDTYGNQEGGVEQQEEGLNLDKLLEMYTQNQVLFFGKIGNGYGALMRGILSASYEIIGETSRVVSIIESSANVVK